MAKKLLETSIGNGSGIAFEYKGKRITNLRQLSKILENECSQYIINDKDGVIVYLSKEEYKKLEKIYHLQK
jgi:hypothetical protein